ncbi:flagellar hook-length control protein FliK [Paracoccus sanguinis]|uniref:flagellar hook-length control protein FliK n=1 Tax=Paracoccus sanguinis TaxID=1545044 RepID=UPI001B8B015A|nr:flagellar hook-length control protein FliK [Paracoccus sanguinis]
MTTANQPPPVQRSDGEHSVSTASDRDEPSGGSELAMQDRSSVAALLRGLPATTPTVAAIPVTGDFAGPKSVPLAEPIRQIADAIVRTREGVVEITLDPIELGRVTVTLAMDRHQSLGIVAERPATLELIRGHTDQLLRDLRDHGMPDARLDFLRGPDGPSAERHLPPPARAGIDDGRTGSNLAGGQGSGNQPSGGSSDHNQSQRPPVYDRSRTESLDTVAQTGPASADTTPALRARGSGRLDLRL